MRKVWALPALLLLALLLTGCAERTYGYKSVAEWSRGRVLGVSSQAEPVALGVAPDGQRIALAWVANSSGNKEVLHLAVLDGKGEVLVDRELPVVVNQPSHLRLALAADGTLHLAWLDEVEDASRLYYGQFSPDGQVRVSPEVLSEAGFRVGGHKLALLPSGDVLEIWATRAGLYAVRLAPDGQEQDSATLEFSGSTQLDFQVAGTDVVHVAWQASLSGSERQLLYTQLELAPLAFSWPMYLDTELLRTGPSLSGSSQQIEGPTIALDGEGVLVNWTLSEIKGTRGDAFYVEFVPGEVKELHPRRIALMPSYPPEYEQASGPFSYRQLAGGVPATAVAYRTDVRGAPVTVSGQHGEVPLALSALVRTAWSPEFQPALVILQDGQTKGYQLVGLTRFPSLDPVLALDAGRQLYMAWIDATGKEYSVYVATTAPAIRAAWDRIGTGDLAVALEQLLGRMISALGVVLLGISWIILPGFFMVVTLFIFREDSLFTARGWTVLYLLVGMHWAGKFIFSPGFLTTLPRLSDLPLIFPLSTLLAPETLAYLPNQVGLPGFLAPLVSYLLPTLTLAIGALVARVVYLKRAREPHAVLAYLIIAVVDIFLAVEIYALTHFDPMRF